MKLNDAQKLAVLLAWEVHELSEGTAAELLGLDRLSLRAYRSTVVAVGIDLWRQWRRANPPAVLERYRHLQEDWAAKVDRQAETQKAMWRGVQP